MRTELKTKAVWRAGVIAVCVFAFAGSTGGQTESLPEETQKPLADSGTSGEANSTGKGGRQLLVVVGAAGEPRYGETFNRWCEQWLVQAAEADIAASSISGMVGDALPKDQLVARLGELAADETLEELWVVLIGHGTFDGKVARFNLAGPDITADEFFDLIGKREKLSVVVNCTSSSSPFISANKNRNCLIATATRDGFEQDFCHFGGFFVDAVVNPDNDLDKDRQVSLLEAFIAAGKATDAFYETEKRLATEHALIEDNGDGLGTPAAWFKGIRLSVDIKDQKPADGLRSNQVFFSRGRVERELSVEQRAERDRLEVEIESLRRRKNRMDEDDYYSQLESVLLQLARLYFPASGPDKQ